MVKNVSVDAMDQKLALAKQCSRVIVNAEGVIAGAKAAVVASVATAIPIYAFGKMSTWAKNYLNPSGKALIVSTVAGMAYFIVADKTVLKKARKNSFIKE